MVSKASKRVLAEYSSAATLAEEILSSVRTAQAFGSEDALATLYDKNLATAQKAGYRKAFSIALLMASMFASMYLTHGLAFCTSSLCYVMLIVGEGSRLVASGDLNVGLVVNILFAILIAASALAQLAPRLQAFISATAAAQKIFQTIRRVPSIDSMAEGGERPEFKGDIEFKNVSFIYPSRPDGISAHYNTNDSHDSEEYIVHHTRGQVDRYRRRLWFRKVDGDQSPRTVL